MTVQDKVWLKQNFLASRADIYGFDFFILYKQNHKELIAYNSVTTLGKWKLRKYKDPRRFGLGMAKIGKTTGIVK